METVVPDGLYTQTMWMNRRDREGEKAIVQASKNTIITVYAYVYVFGLWMAIRNNVQMMHTGKCTDEGWRVCSMPCLLNEIYDICPATVKAKRWITTKL